MGQPSSDKKKRPDFLLRYSSMAIKMVALILAGVFAGRALDDFIPIETPIATLILSLAGVLLSMYVFIRDVRQ
ncbi:AtpZ/AtpI family protein [Salibacteraceae bacterium]|nr:AtpZ/AtpI family protein [Salibacteraceae bacterium]